MWMSLLVVRIFRYQPGPMHPKVFLINGFGAVVSTAKTDNRSIRLDLEPTGFDGLIAQMFEVDFASSPESQNRIFFGAWCRNAQTGKTGTKTMRITFGRRFIRLPVIVPR